MSDTRWPAVNSLATAEERLAELELKVEMLRVMLIAAVKLVDKLAYQIERKAK